MEKLESSLVGMQNDAVWCKLKSKAFDAKLRKQTELPYDSTTPLLGICPKDLNIELGQIFAAMFTAVLFTRANRCKQPMYISREIEKQIVACTYKEIFTFKRKWSLLPTTVQMNFKNRARVCVCVRVRACACALSHVQLFAIPWTVSHQAPLSTGFSRQEYWSGLPFLTPEDFLTHGWNPHLWCLLHWQACSLTLSHLGSPSKTVY